MKNNKLTQKKVLELFKEQGINKNDIRHNLTAIRKAANMFENPAAIFNLVFFNIPYNYSHSYGFHTRQGRELINMFKDSYYYYEQKENSIFKQLKNSINE